MRKFHAEQKENRNRKLLLGLKVLGGVVLLAVILEVWSVNRLSNYGSKLNDLKNSEASLQLENQVLENQIAKNSSLKGVEEKVQSLGFTSIKDIVYIKAPAIASAF